jgi:hypothetical protein
MRKEIRILSVATPLGVHCAFLFMKNQRSASYNRFNVCLS